MKKIMLISLLLFSFFPFSLEGATEEIKPQTPPAVRLEGIMMDPHHEEQSVAIINGNLYKKGEKCGVYQIREVTPDFVAVFNESTKAEERLTVKAQPPKLPAVSTSLAIKTDSEDSKEIVLPPEPSNSPVSFQDQVKQFLKTAQEYLSVTKWVNKVYEIKATVDMARIYNAGVQFFNKNKRLAKDVNELVSANYLPASFKEASRGGYLLYLNSPDQPFGVHADPQNQKSGLRYFFVGQDSVIRVASSKPATSESPPHDY